MYIRKQKIMIIWVIFLLLTLMFATNVSSITQSKNNFKYVFFIGDIYVVGKTGDLNYVEIGEYYIISWDASDMYIRIIGYMVSPKFALCGIDNLVWDDTYDSINGFVFFKGDLIVTPNSFILDGRFIYSRIIVEGRKI